ncbi:MAG: hypothetical protein WCF95_04355 [bacterium]
MIKIKRIKSNNNSSLEHFLLNVFSQMPKINNPIYEFLHSFLPNNQKFLSENYAAIEDGISLCEVSISPQSRKNARWQINRLSIGDCSDDMIAILIKYVMNKYGGDGVETFLTFVNENMPELKELFKKGCSFRECAHLELWNGDNSKIIDDNLNTDFFKDYHPRYLSQIVELHNNMIFPQFRQALKIVEDDFRKRFKNSVFRKILYNEVTATVEGYFLIFKKNDKLYLDILLSDAFASYYPEVLKCCKGYLNDVTVLVKKYHTSSKILVENLSQKDFAKQSSYAILVKDYWSVVKKENESILNLGVNISSPA